LGKLNFFLIENKSSTTDSFRGEEEPNALHFNKKEEGFKLYSASKAVNARWVSQRQ